MITCNHGGGLRHTATVILITILIFVLTMFPSGTCLLFVYATESPDYNTALTDRSNDIGVKSEGYNDSPYDYQKTYSISANLWVPDANLRQGGTVYVNDNRKVWQAEQYWDGKAPFRVTSTSGGRAKFDFQSYNDFLLEDDDGVAPNGAFKLDNIDLLYCRVNVTNKMNLFGRGNKFVIGENVTTESGKLWKLYGGTEHNHDLAGDGRPDVVTNVVVASGHWDYVFGGGEGATGTGTQVTIRGDSNVDNVYGGGERKGSVGIDEAGVGNNKGNPNNPGINVFIEGGNVGTLYGGSAINGKGIFTGSHALVINEDINIDVSGGYVNRLFGGDDTHDDNGDSSGVQPVGHSVMSESPINGDLFVTLSGQNMAGTVVGDVNRNIPRAATNVRQVQGVDRLDVTADQELEYAELFDTINIDGANVKMLNEMGFTTFDSDYHSTEGYVGQIAVRNGGRLELTKRAIINVPYAHYDNTGSWNDNWTEPDKAIKATANHDAYYLVHGFIGESSEAKRADSVIAIDGESAGITAASGERFNDSSDIAGLLIHGSVLGSFGGNHSWNSDVPGYSTLEVMGNPVYSEGDDYYYYILSDGTAGNRTGTTSTAPASVNGGEAFKEPAGADYMVCYRYLKDDKIGWYLRERPEITAENVLAHAGDDSEDAFVIAHVVLNGMSYEWSDDPDENRVGITITKHTGSAATEEQDISILPEELAGIADDDRFSNITYDSDGRVESFDVIIDSTAAGEASYYEIGVTYMQDDERVGVTTDCVRAIYDFVNTTEPEDPDYQDSTMTTMPYDDMPVGADKARLIVRLPYGTCASSLSVSEDNGTFSMTDEDTGEILLASLHSPSTVIRDYGGVTTQTANSAFAVRIGGSDLASGITKNDLTENNEYTCDVLSYKNVSRYEISEGPEGLNGLKVGLTMKDITKDGNPVGTGNPSASSTGELRIKTVASEEEVVPPVTGIPVQEETHEMKLLPAILMAQLVILYMTLKRIRRYRDAGNS